MTKRDHIKNIILRAFDTALNYELADAYSDIVGCGECPYWHDCRNEHDCEDYILEKLHEEKEEEEDGEQGTMDGDGSRAGRESSGEQEDHVQ